MYIYMRIYYQHLHVHQHVTYIYMLIYINMYMYIYMYVSIYIYMYMYIQMHLITSCTLHLHNLYMYMCPNRYGCASDTDHYSSGCFQGVRRGQGVLLPNDDVFLCLLRGADVGLVLRGGDLLSGLVLYALPARVRHQHGLLSEAVRCLRTVRVRAALRDVRTLLEQDWNKIGDS